jgi:hypothetical protein
MMGKINTMGGVMPVVQLDDQVFEVVRKRASDAGYASVDAYVTDMLVGEHAENIDRLFTPERLAHIDKADADIQSGKGYTTEQAEKELARRREKWLQANPR